MTEYGDCNKVMTVAIMRDVTINLYMTATKSGADAKRGCRKERGRKEGKS